MKPRVFVTRAIPQVGLDKLGRHCEVDLWPEPVPPPKEELKKRTEEAEGLLCMLTDPVDAEVIGAAPGLRAISTYAVGFDNIDIRAATERGIPVGHTPGVLTDATADLAFALLMAAGRRVVEGAGFARAGKWLSWSPTLLLGQDIGGATLGILGFGRIGRAVAKRARGFDMEVIFHTPSVAAGEVVDGARAVSLDELLERADFLSLHVPLTNGTRRLIDAPALAKMKPTAVLVNTARGGVVDQDALIAALKNGTIASAALDVTDPEPLPADHQLFSLPNCIVLPHLGSASVTTRDRMAVMAAENLIVGLGGERPPHLANPKVELARR